MASDPRERLKALNARASAVNEQTTAARKEMAEKIQWMKDVWDRTVHYVVASTAEEFNGLIPATNLKFIVAPRSTRTLEIQRLDLPVTTVRCHEHGRHDPADTYLEFALGLDANIVVTACVAGRPQKSDPIADSSFDSMLVEKELAELIDMHVYSPGN
ncbi:MAG TPA: hypothetical protein VMU81_05885 [Acetobacteraceae bacterium]|nr:hypothetical protein [Acetobacteraceae bacterium]